MLKKNVSRLRLITIQSKILKILQDLENLKSSPPPEETFIEYEKINFPLMKSRIISNTKVRKLHMSEVKYSIAVKLAQIILSLSNLFIKSKGEYYRI